MNNNDYLPQHYSELHTFYTRVTNNKTADPRVKKVVTGTIFRNNNTPKNTHHKIPVYNTSTDYFTLKTHIDTKHNPSTNTIQHKKMLSTKYIIKHSPKLTPHRTQHKTHKREHPYMRKLTIISGILLTTQKSKRANKIHGRAIKIFVTNQMTADNIVYTNKSNNTVKNYPVLHTTLINIRHVTIKWAGDVKYTIISRKRSITHPRPTPPP